MPLFPRRANSDSDPFASGCYAVCSGYARHAYRSGLHPAVARVLSTDFPDTGDPGEIGIKYVNDPSPFNGRDRRAPRFPVFFFPRSPAAPFVCDTDSWDRTRRPAIENTMIMYLRANIKFQRDYIIDRSHKYLFAYLNGRLEFRFEK